MDLKKAFDRVPRQLLFYQLYKFGVRGMMFRVIEDIYTRHKARDKIGKNLSPEFEIQLGVLQGSKLGPLLF